jgi:hypothetical protein
VELTALQDKKQRTLPKGLDFIKSEWASHKTRKKYAQEIKRYLFLQLSVHKVGFLVIEF